VRLLCGAPQSELDSFRDRRLGLPTQRRSVVVQDTVCPVITMVGKSVVSIEAGFTYSDKGATASDSLDGVLSEKITTSGDSVDTFKAFKALRSCAEISKRDPKAQTASYFITTTTSKRVKVWCDMATGLTYYACNNCKAVTPYTRAQGACGGLGLAMASKISSAAKRHFGHGQEEAKYFPLDKKAKTNYYLCTVSPSLAHKASNSVRHSDIAHAEQGKYIINFHVKDKAGNSECSTPHRTVIVVDTLPPVISLKFKQQIVHISGHSKKGLNGESNPAGSANGNPYIDQDIGLMEVQMNHSGWALAALASSVTGLALVALSLKHRATAAPVPV